MTGTATGPHSVLAKCLRRGGGEGWFLGEAWLLSEEDLPCKWGHLGKAQAPQA